MSLLTIVQAAADRIGVTRPASAYNSTDQQVIQLVALAQQEGKELARRHDWQILTKEKTFTGTAAAAQTGAVASDFDRMVNESFFNRTQKRPVYGPITAAEWQFTQSVLATTLVESFRFRGNSILITPTPNGTDSYAYEYLSNQWCESSGGTDQTAWASDTDTGILDEGIMSLGIVWRFLRSKGFDYDEPFRTYETRLAELINRDGAKRTIQMGRRLARYPRGPLTPEGSWSL